MSHFGSSVEYGLHCLLYLVDTPADALPSSRDLAEFQGVSPSYVAKLFTRLEKAGLVTSAEGVRGGYRLAKPAEAITVLDVVDALDGDKALFRCREVRGNCILFDGEAPRWATRGTCGIHAIMREAELKMRTSLKAHTLASLAGSVAQKLPAAFLQDAEEWFKERGPQRLHIAKPTQE